MNEHTQLIVIVQTLKWPIVVLIVLLVLIVVCRKEIRNLLGRIKQAKLPWGGVSFEDDQGKSSHDIAASSEVETLSVNERIKWNNSGNLFWLAHDLMWTINALSLNAPRDAISHGLKQSLHHIRELGFSGDAIEVRLARLKDEAERTLESDWSVSKRQEYVQELHSIIGQAGALAKANQPGFLRQP